MIKHRAVRVLSELPGREAEVFVEDDGYLAQLRRNLPKPPNPELTFAVVPDGDQRSSMSDEPIANRWPLHFLPTGLDPDRVFRSLRSKPAVLAEALGTDQSQLQRRLDDLEGEDDHDWVNRLGDAYGRAHALTVLATCWANAHVDEAQAFAELVRAGV